MPKRWEVIFFGGLVCIVMLMPSGAYAYDPDGFNKCILTQVDEARTEFGAKQSLKACARMHNTDFQGERRSSSSTRDFEKHAPFQWSQVVSSEEFINADQSLRNLLRMKYLEWVVVPSIPTKQRENLEPEVRELFLRRTEKHLDATLNQDPP